MCGIWAIFGNELLSVEERICLVERLLNRGPELKALQDISGTNITLGFTRLAINGLTPAGNQPFSNGDSWVICNGEIYNFKELATRWNIPLAEGTSDCAVLLPLLANMTVTELCRTLDGVFAFVIVDAPRKQIIVARDPYGVRPLFQGRLGASTVFSSELKGLPNACRDVKPFPPGTWSTYSVETGELLESQTYHSYQHVKMDACREYECAKHVLRASLLSAVRKRLLSDRPIGALLSGGVDSSLIAAIAARELNRYGKKLHTFSIGMPGSTDLDYARKVADHIGSIHHPVIVTPEDFLKAISHVIHDIESYDITSVRASVGNWLIGKYIRENTDIKVVFNGDGADEIGGGYLYFNAAPSDEAFETEIERLLSEIHMYDVLRSDRSMASHGLEARTPFLDKNVVATWLAIPTRFRRPIPGKQQEKLILREAFELDRLIPDEVLFRKKEAFSDGVSSREDSWYKRCAEFAKTRDVRFDSELYKDAHNPPLTEEAFFYRSEFEANYPAAWATVIPRMWLPRWIAGATDPSARTLGSLYA